MSDYNARKAELLADLDKLMAGKFEPWRAALGAPVGDIMNARSTALNAYAMAVCDNADEDIANDVEEKIRYAQDTVLRPLPEVGSRIKDLDADLVCWVGQISVEEARFLAGLAGMGLGKLRDQMRRIDVDLKILIDTLQRKWATMSEANQRLEQVEAEASVKMTQTMQSQAGRSADFLDQAANLVSPITNWIVACPKLANELTVYLAKEAGCPEQIAKRIPDIKDLGKYHYGGASLSNEINFTQIEAKEIAKVLPVLMRDSAMVFTDNFKELFPKEYRIFLELAYKFFKEVLPYYLQGYKDSVAAYQAMLPNQGSVLVSLSQTRHDVEAFLNVCGMEQLRKTYDSAIALLDLWLGTTMTTGMKADAQAVRDGVKAMFDRRFQETSHLFEEFIRAEQGRFVGTVKEETEKALLWTPIWIDRERGIAEAGMYERLRAHRDSSLHITDKLDDAMAQVRDRLRSSLPAPLGDNAVAALDKVFGEVKSKLKDALAETATALDQAATAAAPEAIKRDLDRSRLRALVAAG